MELEKTHHPELAAVEDAQPLEKQLRTLDGNWNSKIQNKMVLPSNIPLERVHSFCVLLPEQTL